MNAEGRRYVLAGVCTLSFILAQTFRAFAYWFWLRPARTPREDLVAYSLRLDQVRALLVLGAILLLIVPYAVIARRCSKVAPLASISGFTFGVMFVIG